jgi:hypothetical protein
LTQILVSISLLTQILVSISLLKQILCKDFMANGFFFHAMSFWLDDCNCEFEKKIVNLMIVVGPSRVKLKCTPVHECTALLSLLNLRYLSSLIVSFFRLCIGMQTDLTVSILQR